MTPSGKLGRPLQAVFGPDEATNHGASSEIQIVWRSDFILAKVWIETKYNKCLQIEKKADWNWTHFSLDTDLSVFCIVANRLEPRSGPT